MMNEPVDEEVIAIAPITFSQGRKTVVVDVTLNLRCKIIGNSPQL